MIGSNVERLRFCAEITSRSSRLPASASSAQPRAPDTCTMHAVSSPTRSRPASMRAGSERRQLPRTFSSTSNESSVPRQVRSATPPLAVTVASQSSACASSLARCAEVLPASDILIESIVTWRRASPLASIVRSSRVSFGSPASPTTVSRSIESSPSARSCASAWPRPRGSSQVPANEASPSRPPRSPGQTRSRLSTRAATATSRSSGDSVPSTEIRFGPESSASLSRCQRLLPSTSAAPLTATGYCRSSPVSATAPKRVRNAGANSVCSVPVPLKRPGTLG